MSVTKWSPTLTQEEDSPIVPVWISIPHLPIHLHEQTALFSIASMLGTPLKVDNATLNFARPKFARVCVELDVSRNLHQRIHVRHADADLFFQVVYEDPPLFCNSCRKLGHNHLTCKPVTQPAKRDIPAHKVQDNNDDKVQQGWTKVTRKGKAPAIPKQGDISKPVPHVWAPKPTIREEHVETSKTGARRRAPVFLPSTNVFFLDPSGLAHSDLPPHAEGTPVSEPPLAEGSPMSELPTPGPIRVHTQEEEHFGNIFDLVEEAEDEASTAEINFEKDPSDTNQEIVNLKKAQLLQVGNLEHSYWKQKYHHHNQDLMHLPSEDEIKAILFDMESNSCAGPDGFNVNFFKECWDIVKREVISACQEVFMGIPLPVAAASTNICLIPKCDNASRLNDFRPVCLSTVASKIATKCIAKRLRKVLPLIISEEQGAFVAGRDIMEQILLTKEMAHNIDRKAGGGNIILKLDMAKAFDKLKNSIHVTHLAYADDLIIFTNAHLRSISNLKTFLAKYQQVSGQTINSSKSSFMVGKKFNTMRIRKLEQLLTMPHRKLPFTYLGSPIHSGITRKHHCTSLISSFDKKLNGWYQKNLDQAGRLILINHVLNTIPNYFLAANTVPRSIINLLHQKMAGFWWGCGQKKHHWLKWDSLSLPKEEGGIGTRDFQSLEEAFSLKLWWKYQHNNSLWGRFMRAKYHRRGEMECHLVDSPTWTRITRINVKALNHCHTTEEEAFIWNEDPSGQFTLKSAYEVCRTNSSPSLAFHNIWESPQKSKISIFMWKLLRKCLPIPENLRRLGFALPSVCPFCMNSSLTTKHSLIDCAKIVDIWRHYARCLNFLHTESSTINQHFMNWWLRDTPNLYGLLRKHLPGIITWHICKKMNEIIYGKCSNFSTLSLIHQIDSYTKQWLSTKTPRKLQHFDSWLFSHNLIPRFTSHNYVRMVKWKAPPTGRLKLNVDASYTTTHQRGAAILRDAEGRLVRGASFKLHSRSAYQAEVDAAIKAIIWALLISNSLIYETDAKSIISRIPLFNKNSVSSFPIDVLGQLILQNGIQVSHILREGNSAADGLAKEEGCKTIGSIKPSPSGKPAVFFSDEDLEHIRERFPFAVKARYKRDTTPEEIGKSLEKGGFKGGFRISGITRYQVIIVFNQQGDYLRILSRRSWSVNGNQLSICKWDPSTEDKHDSPLALIWVTLKHLPFFLLDKRNLFSVVKVTSNYWVRNITVVYDQPLYCKSCKRWGHCCTSPSTAGRVLTGGELQTGDRTTNRGSFEWIRVERKGKKPLHVNTRKREPTRLQTSNKFQALEDKNSADTMVGAGPSSIFQPSVIPKAVTSLEAGPSTCKVGIFNDKIPLQTLGSISPGNPSSLLVKQTALEHTSTLDSLGLLSTYADPETPCTPVCIHSDGEEMNSFKLKLGMTHAASFLHNQLWIFWMEPTLTLLQTVELEQVVHCHFNSPTSPSPIWISSIYGKHSRSSRKTLWESISKCNPGTQPWILGGDFNCIHNIDEHKGNTEPCHNSIEDFRNCMEANNLLYLPPSGGHFSWSGSRSSGKVWRRLDHIFCTQPVLDQFPTLSLEMLSKGSSDHRPLLLKYSLSSFSGHKPFKFLNMWTSHHSLEATIRNFWESNKTFNGMQGLANKLKALKPILIKWNGEVFGNIFQKLNDAEASAQTTQTFYEPSIPLHILAIQQMPKSVMDILNKKMQNFFWGYRDGKPKYH
ncbi:unnamed protein product [Cuscuta campestris]|uniref:Reverse transcriptase domain-containing protein n=1 Tax=Cuscuta campestris TaxID=132261 RepID=A0A484KE76_9ASTE|nr:unnamed protein product [Cuscuta campestris]